MKVDAANRGDMLFWLSLAGEVEHLFGPMAADESFQNALLLSIDDGNAYCIRRKEETGLCGGVIIDPANHEIVWLAVSESCRRRGAGSLLLDYAIEHLDHTVSINLVTFADTVPEGRAARELYLKFGFRDRKPVGKNPAGFPVVLMVRII